MPLRKPKQGESLGDLYPEIAKQWHPTKNGNLTPFDFFSKSNKKVWWKCSEEEDHEWETPIHKRTIVGNGCLVCGGRKVVKSNCLATTHPKIALEWHPTKNDHLTPYDFTSRSEKKVWWKCAKGDDHEWVQMIYNRSKKGHGCTVCSGRKTVLSNCLATTHPEIAIQWHPTKNGSLNAYDVTRNSSKKVWWKCPKGDDHEWETTVDSRSENCPFCVNQKLSKTNSLKNVRPDIAKQWHPIKNGIIKPEDIVKGTNKKFWWKCPEGDDHEWKESPNNRTSKNYGCPICSNQKAVKSNCLKTTHPKISKLWHPTKNKSVTPYEIVAGSPLRIWWQCPKGKDHVWKTEVRKLTERNYGCPFCSLTPQSREELIITHELITIFKGINPKGFKTRVKGKLRSIDIYIPDLKLGIEFDGYYWHKDKRALDKLKTEELEAEGINIIRVRQKPLKRIFEDDVMAEKKYDGKKVTNDILTQIMKDYKLGQSTILKINKYIEKPNLQNEKGLEKYIDMILTEKAEKK